MAGFDTVFTPGSWGASTKDLYGTKPVVPKAVDYGSAITDAIQWNIKSLPSLAELARLSTVEMMSLLEQTMPGYGKLRDSITEANQNLVSGDATEAERNSMRRLAAEQNWSSGTPGSDFGNYKELGLNFQRMQERTRFGLNSAANWIQTAKGSAFDFTKMFQDKGDAKDQADATWSRNWLAAQVKASPDPQVRGQYDSEMAVVGMILSAYGGGPGYTGQSKPSYSSGQRGMSDQSESFWGAGDSGYGGGAPDGGSFEDYYGGGGGGVADFF